MSDTNHASTGHHAHGYNLKTAHELTGKLAALLGDAKVTDSAWCAAFRLVRADMIVALGAVDALQPMPSQSGAGQTGAAQSADESSGTNGESAASTKGKSGSGETVPPGASKKSGVTDTPAPGQAAPSTDRALIEKIRAARQRELQAIIASLHQMTEVARHDVLRFTLDQHKTTVVNLSILGNDGNPDVLRALWTAAFRTLVVRSACIFIAATYAERLEAEIANPTVPPKPKPEIVVARTMPTAGGTGGRR